MKVILTEKVKSLGSVGEVHNVSPGFARNYLIPNHYAVIADEGNQRLLDEHKKALANKIAQEKEAATEIKKKLDGFSIKVEKKVGGSGKLFGTVTAAELSQLLEKEGIEVEKRHIVIETPIKQLGKFEITAKLFEDVISTFNVEVEMSAKQAAELEKKAKAKKAAPKKKEEKEAAAEEMAAEETAGDNNPEA